MKYDNDNPDRLSLWHILAGFGWGILVCLLISLLIGCKSIRYVPVETVRTDTLYKTQVQRDSIHLHDSIYIHEWQKGDTVCIERDRWRVMWRDRWHTDTVYKSRTDSVAVPYPVEKQLTKWQRFCLDYGKVTTGATGVLALLAVAWIVRRVRKG